MMFLSDEQRAKGEALLTETEALIGLISDPRSRIYYQAKARGLQASLDEDPQTRWIEIEKRILSFADSPNESRRIDAIGYGDGFQFNEPGVQIGPEHLDFRYTLQPADAAAFDLGHVWMERFPGGRRECLYIDYPQPENTQILGMRPGHFRFRQIHGTQNVSQFHHPLGVFPFEGNSIRDTYIASDSVADACQRFFLRFDVSESRYKIGS